MNKLLILSLFIGTLLTSCKKDKKDEAEPDECLIGTSKLTATINSAQWCANQTLFADQAIVLTINGIRSDGSTLTLELDNFQPGTYAINSDTNHILYTNNLAIGYESTSDNPGTLTVTQNDAATNHFKANFTVTLREPIASQSIPISGSVDVLYTE